MRQSIVYTVTANCQDCYRCLRACPVKAIRVSGGQARIEDNLCIQCGTCVHECPQRAKKIRSDLEGVKKLLESGRAVAASVAPSFAAAFGDGAAGRLPAMLRGLGFRHVAETAEGAKYITEKSFGRGVPGNVCTACPAVVNYIEKYRPDLLEHLIPVVSPMIAHGRKLKMRHTGCAVVFIGPCAAKKEEALRPENREAVDFVLTFEELEQWLREENITPELCSGREFDRDDRIGDARLFPLEGGMLKTGGLESDPSVKGVLCVSGADEVISLLADSNTMRAVQYIEPLFCKGGCIGGPAFPDGKTMFERRGKVIDYWQDKPEGGGLDSLEVFHTASFSPKPAAGDNPPENQVNNILEKMGKLDPAFQLNCGACGYKTCLENAVAVAGGMAEAEMCIAYTRRLAQQRTDRIIDTTPNGVVILDGELRMIQMNPAFQKMFTCNNGILGRRISYLLNADGFEALQAGSAETYESIQTKYGVRYHEILYGLRDEEQYVGIYSDISKIGYDANQLDVIKAQTLMHAREFLEHQVRFAQEMAHYLGKSTARSEEIAKKLIDLYEESETGEPR